MIVRWEVAICRWGPLPELFDHSSLAKLCNIVIECNTILNRFHSMFLSIHVHIPSPKTTDPTSGPKCWVSDQGQIHALTQTRPSDVCSSESRARLLYAVQLPAIVETSCSLPSRVDWCDGFESALLGGFVSAVYSTIRP